ncbi:MAG: phytanoyl-CoA dioxygenase family protein [Spirosomataceae bacterium]
MSAVTTLPQLDTLYPISAEQHKEYSQNGHILLRGVISSDEVAAYREVISDATMRYNKETRKMEDRDTYGKAFLQIMNLWEVDEHVRQFVLAKRFAHIAADLMGVEKVRLYHDQALYKEAGGGPTPWHQDQYYWPIDTPNTITMWMPLVDITVEMGMLTFASGSQTEGFVGNLAISDESEAALSTLVEQKGYPVTRAVSMKAGDATFHAGWTLHSAPGNQSDTMREVMTIIFYADGAKVIEPKNHNQEADRQRWICGLEPGSLAASSLNPLLM